MSVTAATISVEPASAAEAPILENLLELYIHDLSAAFPEVQLGDDGRFGYPKLPLYWSEPDRRFPFLIRLEHRLVGFALVTRGSPFAEDPAVLDVAEFFILRRHRRSNAGREAAVRLWRSMPGEWIVRVSRRNPDAIAFWSRVVTDFSQGAATTFEREVRGGGWLAFSFASG